MRNPIKYNENNLYTIEYPNSKQNLTKIKFNNNYQLSKYHNIK